MTSAVKRMHSDIRDYLHSKSLNEQGIFCSFDDENVFHVRAMIIGPEDTPYESGFYFFDMLFPKDYPHNPPAVTYETRRGKIRFHPNLYANAKVCLSILGTWSGPSWTSAQTLSSILLTIQSLLTKDPLTNEPGFATRRQHTEKRHNSYETMVTHENYKTAIFHMMINPPNGFEAFLPVMQQCFVANVDRIHKKLHTLHEKEPVVSAMRCGVYGFETLVDYTARKTEFDQVVQQLVPDYKPKHDLLAPAQPAAGGPGPGNLGTANELPASAPAPPAPPAPPAHTAAAACPATPSAAPKPNPNPKPKAVTSSRNKRPKLKANDPSMQGKTVAVEQGHGKPPIHYESRKCKTSVPNQPEKWQWRQLKMPPST